MGPVAYGNSIFIRTIYHLHDYIPPVVSPFLSYERITPL
jgi:hypothetical protein